MAAEQPKTIRLADYRAPDFLAETIDLTFDLDPKATRVTARSAFRRNPVHKGDGKGEGRPLVLDGEGMKLVSITVDGRALGEKEYRSEEHTSELQSLMRISYAVFCLQKKKSRDNNIQRSIT